MLSFHDDDVPTQAWLLLNQCIRRYNNNLLYFTNGWMKYGFPLMSSGALSSVLGFSSSHVDTLAAHALLISFGCFCISLLLMLGWTQFRAYYDTPELIYNNPTQAAFYASFHGEVEKDISSIQKDGEMWKYLCKRHEERERKYNDTHRPKSNLVYSMVIDAISHIPNLNDRRKMEF